MTPSSSQATAVIITARNAADTAADAVRSALAQRIVAEVVFVDDGSTDTTSAVAASADDNSGRLKIIRLDVNRGPAVGRNVAIAASRSPFLCILDADDFLAPSRLEEMFAKGGEGWDILADDLIFTDGPNPERVVDHLFGPDLTLPHEFTISEFAAGNVAQKGRYRRELGFLKPLVRRSFTERHGIIYNEAMRLGEDALYYLDCLLAGGVFRAIEACGYYAVQSPQSLSGAAHATPVLRAQFDGLGAFKARLKARGLKAAGVDAYLSATAHKLAISRILEAKRLGGWPGVARVLPACEANPLVVIADLALMKLRRA